MINEENRPLYYIDRHFAPELGEDYSNWNNISDYLPDMNVWIWDQLEYYIRRNIKIKRIKSVEEVKIITAFKTARTYHETSVGSSTVNTVVTHLYVCELLAQVLVVISGGKWSVGHGYSFQGAENLDVNSFDAFLTIKKDGLAQELHKLFFLSPMDYDVQLKLKDYLLFCPELNRFFIEVKKIPSNVLSCNDGFSTTSFHKDQSKIYHGISFSKSEYFTGVKNRQDKNYNAKDEHEKNFPELNGYDVGNGQYSPFSIEDEKLSDKFVSVTRDPNGKTFALAFGGSCIQKQRDIEIRFAIIFILGSLGRYRPWIWEKLQEQNPEEYFAIKKFLEHNHVMFPYLILCYLSGKFFTFNKTAVFG